MTDKMKKEFTWRITESNPTELTVVLFEVALAYVQEAMDYDVDNRHYREAIRKGRRCVYELMATLDESFAISANLKSIYQYVNRELQHADLRRDQSGLQEVRKILIQLKDAFHKIARQDERGKVMENVQPVYAGLTYERNNLAVNAVPGYENRGYLI